MKENKVKDNEIDWYAIIIPLVGVIIISILFLTFPDKSMQMIQVVRAFLGNQCGIYYAVLGLGIFFCSIYMAFSDFGKILLGKSGEKKRYSSLRWGMMIFTSTMAADILFYSLCEWALYANEPYIEELGGIQKWASTYPLFHWGPIVWSMYIVLAVAFGFMLHVRGRNRQKFSEACRSLLKEKVDGIWGKLIDLVAIFALIAGTATTFSLATPLLSSALCYVFQWQKNSKITVLIFKKPVLGATGGSHASCPVLRCGYKRSLSRHQKRQSETYTDSERICYLCTTNRIQSHTLNSRRLWQRNGVVPYAVTFTKVPRHPTSARCAR